MGVKVKARVLENINYAEVHCKETIMKRLELETEENCSVVLRIYAEPAIIFEYKKEMTLEAGSVVLEGCIELNLDDAFFRHELIEAREGEIKIEVLDPGNPERVLGFQNVPVHIQPYTHWNAARPQFMPAFMQPNDPLVGKVLKVAGEYAEKMGISMYGYQGGDGENVLKQCECIYRALQDEGLHYISSPASFENVGQKLRIPHLLLHAESKQGTCLDLSVLFASCLEAASLNPIIVVIPGHAFAGVWLRRGVGMESSIVFKEQMDDEAWADLKRSVMPVECTTFTDGRGIDFVTATAVGQKNIEECRYLIDVSTARDEGICPVYAFTDTPICAVNQETKDEPEEKPEECVDLKASVVQNSRYDILRKQAMDTSYRNKLLSGRKDSCEITFSIPVSEYLKNQLSEEKLVLMMRDAQQKAGNTEEQIDECLRRLRLNNLEVRREKGKGNLYLALNTLVWKPEGQNKNFEAVLYFCPAEIARDRRGEYFFRADREKIRFNPVLKEMLHQEYNIDIGDMLDDPGEEYESQMQSLRYCIEKKKDWSVKENTARLALFNIPNEAVWRGLSRERVLNHDVVRSILKESMDWEEERTVEDENKEKVYAFQTDSSQAEIIQSAFTKKAQVVRGGAGSGKTSTVVNIMIEAMKKGERVLFVSEKPTALSVAREMMEEAGLGDFCLEVMEGVDTFQDVAGKIKNTLRCLELHENIEPEYCGKLRKYEDAGERIRRYYELMKQKGSCGKSLEELYQMYENYRDCPETFKWNADTLKMDVDDAEIIMEYFAEMLRTCDPPQNKYMVYLRTQELNGEERQAAEEAVENVLKAGDRLWRGVQEFERWLQFPVAGPKKVRIQKMVSYASILEKYQELDIDFSKENPHKDNREEIAVREEMLSLVETIRNTGGRRFGRGSAEKDLGKFLSQAVGKNESRELLRTCTPDELKEEILRMDLSSFNVRKDKHNTEYADREYYAECMEGLENCLVNKGEAERKCIMNAAQGILAGKKPKLREKATFLCQFYKRYKAAQDKAEELVAENIKQFEQDYPGELKMELFKEWKQIHDNGDKLKSYEKIRKQAEQAGLGSLVGQMEEAKRAGKISADDIVPAFWKCWCSSQIRNIRKEIPELQEFNAITYNRDVRIYRREEEKIREDIRKNVRQLQFERLPDVREGAVNMPELGCLQKIARKPKKMTIRSIFEQAPNIITQMFPCMLMNPEAVAEYLPEDMDYDIVILDEASQLPTHKALIPISYGKRCMIFGDEMQLAPTKFFEKMLEDEEGDAMPMESILDTAIVTNAPRALLRYHYRSARESLIAFSNQKYYNNEIITFPSCSTKVTGVFYEFVEDGCYDRGKTKTNLKEAERVICKLKEIYAGLPDDTEETAGVITMNLNQKNLIQSLLIHAAVEDAKFGRKAEELISVVNLEASQGKEWDRVILSPGYGPDKNGDFSMNLGTLSQAHGSNRLNVMITRSKTEMYVITSLKPEMLANAASEGVRDLRDFLAYARGDISYDKREEQHTVRNSREQNVSVFADSVAEGLRKRGYTVHTNIGSSECKVDIGIVSEKDESRYVLGILLDHFKESRKVGIRDREVIFPEALKRKGWEIYRMYSPNWYENPENELDEIKKIITQIEGEV